MNKIQFPALGGHYLKIQDFEFEKASIMESLSALALAMIPGGEDTCILWGCEFITDAFSTQVTEGAVYYEGEIYAVPAGSLVVPFASCFLKITETPTGDRPMYVARQMVLDGSSGEIALPALSHRANTAPKGTLKPWYPRSGQSLDAVTDGTGLGKGIWLGWALCNGQNGTPNLGGRTLVASGQRDSGDVALDDTNTAVGIGDKAGRNGVALTIAQLPSHDHTMTNRSSDDSGGDSGTVGVAVGSADTVDNVPKTDSAGSGESHENRMPYMGVAYFQKL